ncbi:hypothetical protein GCK72_020221 [Caenorhabditis remanei]|uniref:SPK domain-containing protein n=1 Tax=Caenorhabditis remanei TaxID=31234 RepID=A0A6A5GFY2_CAERE|nr:hypothetical protein GCK72_020221 [Caenorhabditis remanei]KAF1753664.1 hypothetical protein GCK72_020221 [Caenorhabditis remanei]
MLEAFLSRMLEISQAAVVFKSIKNEILAFFESLSLSLPERPRLIDFENRVIEELEKEIDVRQRFTGIDVLKMIHVFRLEMSDSCYEKILCLGKLSLSEEKKIISFSSNDRSFRIKEPTPEIIIEFMTTICDTLHQFKTFVDLANRFQQWRKRKFWGPVDHHSFVNLFTKLTERISEAVPFYHCLNLQKKIDNKEIIDGPYLMKLRTYFINVDLADWPHEDIVISFSAPSNCFDAFREKLLEIRIIKEEIFETEEVGSSNPKGQSEALEDEAPMTKKAKIDNQSQSNSPHQQQNLDTLDASLDQCVSSIDADVTGPSTSGNIISEENISNDTLMAVVPYFCHFDDHDYLQYKVDFIQEQQDLEPVSPEQQIESTSTLDEHPSGASNPVDEIGEANPFEMGNGHPMANGSIGFLEETGNIISDEELKPSSSNQKQADEALRPVHQSEVMTTQKQGESCNKEQLNKFLELIDQMVAALQKNNDTINIVVSDEYSKLTTKPFISFLTRVFNLLRNGRQHKFVDLDKRILIYFAQYQPLHESIIAELISTERIDDFELDWQGRITYYQSGEWRLGEKSNVHQSFKFFWKDTTPLQRELLILLADLSSRRSSIMSLEEVIDEFQKINADISDNIIFQELINLLPKLHLAPQYSVKTRVQMIFLTQSNLNKQFKAELDKYGKLDCDECRKIVKFVTSDDTLKNHNWSLSLHRDSEISSSNMDEYNTTITRQSHPLLTDATSLPVQERGERNAFPYNQVIDSLHTSFSKSASNEKPMKTNSQFSNEETDDLMDYVLGEIEKHEDSFRMATTCKTYRLMKKSERGESALIKKVQKEIRGRLQCPDYSVEERIFINWCLKWPLHNTIVKELILNKEIDNFEIDEKGLLVYYESPEEGGLSLGIKSKNPSVHHQFWINATEIQKKLLNILSSKRALISTDEIIEEYQEQNAPLDKEQILDELNQLLPNLHLARQYDLKTRAKMVFWTQSKLHEMFEKELRQHGKLTLDNTRRVVKYVTSRYTKKIYKWSLSFQRETPE